MDIYIRFAAPHRDLCILNIIHVFTTEVNRIDFGSRYLDWCATAAIWPKRDPDAAFWGNSFHGQAPGPFIEKHLGFIRWHRLAGVSFDQAIGVLARVRTDEGHSHIGRQSCPIRIIFVEDVGGSAFPESLYS